MKSVTMLSLSLAALAALAPARALAQRGETSLSGKVVDHYVSLAHARYQDSLETAQRMTKAIQAFLRTPSPKTHRAAKDAWINAHAVYSHTEVFRFGNPNVDAWEGRVNAWPMDEGFVDYVNRDKYVHNEGNPHAFENIIGSRKYPIYDDFIEEAHSGTDPKAAPITQFTDAEANLAIGFHVIEFLLWGQDLNETPTSSGKRSYTDYVKGKGGTNGNMDRRSHYLAQVCNILTRDLLFMVRDWDPTLKRLYAQTFRELPREEQLRRILLGMGSLSFGELAGERIEVALVASDQEDEQSCFSDTTHLDIFNNAKCIQTLYLGIYKRANGKSISGASLSNLVAKHDPALDRKLQSRMKATMKEITAFAKRAEKEPFDQMVLASNSTGRAQLSKIIDLLRKQTEVLEEIMLLRNKLAKL